MVVRPCPTIFGKFLLGLGAMSSAHSFSIRFGIPSGPEALFGFKSRSNFVIPFTLIVIGGILFCIYLFVFGFASVLSMVKTDLNISTWALLALSLTSRPPYFSGDTPMLSCRFDLM